MKKLAVLGSSVLLAAVPVVGAFAATNSLEETVTVTVDESCTISQSEGQSSSTAPGDPITITSPGIEVSCNDNGGWKLQAVGSSDVSKKTVMKADDESKPDIATGTTFSGAASAWGFQITTTEGVTAAETYGTAWNQIPDEATTIATSDKPTSKAKVTPKYQIYIAPTQSAGTYTGKVTYTVLHPKS